MGMGLAVDANDKDYSATWEFFRHTGMPDHWSIRETEDWLLLS